MATTDGLTGLANRHGLRLLLEQAVHEAGRQGTPLSAVMFDVDHFKDINDRHGHIVGDRALRSVAERLRDRRRSSDIVCRWGGEEFLLVLKATDLAAATRIAEDIRQRIAHAPFVIDGLSIPLTVSAGVACHRSSEAGDDFLLRADNLLYKAKTDGRDRVCSEGTAMPIDH